MSLLEQFKDPALVMEMTFGEKLLASTYTAILGMSITFVVLVLIWGAIALMTKFAQGVENKPHKSEVLKAEPKPAAQPSVSAAAAPAEDLALVAVIAAAVAASLGTTPDRIRVTNIVRTQDATPTWGQAGRREMIDNAL